VGGDGRKRVSLESKDSSLEQDLVFGREEVLRLGYFGSVFTEGQLR
jgi:hypothetical protein